MMPARGVNPAPEVLQIDPALTGDGHQKLIRTLPL